MYDQGSPLFLVLTFNIHTGFFFLTAKHFHLKASLVAQMVNHLPAMQDTWVLSLGQENPVEKELATHSCTVA